MAAVADRFGSVVVADGDEEERHGIATALRRAGYDAIEVGTGAEALAAANRSDVALLMLEVSLPDTTGYQVCHALRENGGSELPIFFLSGTRTEPMDRVAGLLLGADDFIVKPFDADELVTRAGRFVTRGGPRRPRDDNADSPQLTRRETQILALLAAGQRQKEIARELSISPKTVATHVQNLLGKFGVNSRAVLVARAYLLGLVDGAGR
jgi:DNA-binding NarL/FixJ family response regulator